MRPHFPISIAAAALCAFAANAQRSSGIAADNGTRTLLSLDSARLGSASISPDARWLVFSRFDDAGRTSSIWIAATTSPKPIRLTSQGYRDTWPIVSPTGDRVFFVSNRPTRDARSMATHAMSIALDLASGRPAGPVRQVTTDSVGFLAPNAISLDGKWLTYMVPGTPATVRIVPTVGGISRVLTTKHTLNGLYATFTADGRSVVFQDSGGLRAVDLATGRVTTVVRRDTAAPAAFRADRYITVRTDARDQSISGSDLRGLRGEMIGSTRFTMPERSTILLRSDGRGWVGMTNVLRRSVIRISLPSRTTATLVTPRPGWPFGVASDGAIITSRSVNGRVVVTSAGPRASSSRDVVLGPDIDRVVGLLSGGDRLLALGPAQGGALVKTRLGNVRGVRPAPAYVVERTTGRARKIADSVLSGCCPRNWGAAEDAVGIAQRRGTVVDISSIDGNGRMQLLHSLPLPVFQRIADLAIREGRVAYAESVGKDSIGIFVAVRPGTPFVRIGVVSQRGGDIAIGWSPDGQKLAAAYGDATKPRPVDRARVRRR